MNPKESMILKHLLKWEDFCRKVLPYLKVEYFQDATSKALLTKIADYVKTYNGIPTSEAIIIMLDQDKDVTDSVFQETGKFLNEIESDNSLPELQWLLDETESFCQSKAIYNGIMKSISILDNKDKADQAGLIPTMLSDALSVSFDPNIGHDFIENADDRFEWYHTEEERIPFDIDYLNTITKGGLPRKTLNMILASTGVGKTLIMCHMATGFWLAGKNVLYITMEMSEERIAERIDANALNVNLNDLTNLPKPIYDNKIAGVKSRTAGKLIVKEFPTASAHVGHFRHLLRELKIKKKFVPDVIIVDYLNICCSSRIQGQSSSVNSYTLIKSVAEELRGLAVECNVPVISGTQTNRGGFNNSDIEMGDISESAGTSMTVDFLIAVISTEELQTANQFLFKQLKNRYNDFTMNQKFVVGVDRPKMRLFNCENSAQDGVIPQTTDDPFTDGAFDERKNEIKAENKFGAFDFS